jgi:hypothetical protein
MDLLTVVLQQKNMTFVHVTTSDVFEGNEISVYNLIKGTFAKTFYTALGDMGKHSMIQPFMDFTNTYFTVNIRWYIPCSIKLPRWSSIFRILSVELWLFPIISIVIVAISITLVGRYSCTSGGKGTSH